MKNELEKQNGNGIARRSLMKLGGLSLLSLGALNFTNLKNAFAGEKKWNEPGITGNIAWYWDDKGHPVQRTVDTGKLQDGKIKARVDGKWSEFAVKEVDQGFRDFQSKALVEIYNKIIETSSPVFGGIYCPCIISNGGIPRGDSKFKLNGAYKFVFPCPKEEHIDEITQGLLDRAEDDKGRREWMRENWGNQDLWNYSILVGRDETVQGPKDERTNDLYRETHSFRNLMENPLATLLFLSSNSFTSYEARTICHYVGIDKLQDTVDTYEKKISKFINILGYTSHKVDKTFPGMIFYVIEEFDNSMIVGKEGMRVVKIKDSLKKIYAKLPWAKQSTVG